MIPLRLSLSGFLSYRDPVEIDFSPIQLACISGPNGAGKSSLLDAITWALFGQARKRDESLINQQSNAAEVILDFEYEGNRYRVQRALPRGKTTTLDFYLWEQQLANRQGKALSSGKWRAITERTLRETQARIERTLRLDYETFVNASFFLQGKADQFAQQRPGDRKRILSSILGLEVWETYRQRVAERRKIVEAEMDQVDGRMAEIRAELSEEQERRARLQELQVGLSDLTRARQAQENALEGIRRVAATLVEQRRLVTILEQQLESAQTRLRDLNACLLLRQQERESYAAILGRADEIEAAYARWQLSCLEVARFDEIASRFRQHEQRRQEPLMQIEAERARLLQEQEILLQQEAALESQSVQAEELRARLRTLESSLKTVEDALARRPALDADLQEARQRQAEARAENPRLKAEMDELKRRIDQLQSVEGAACPLCGQALDVPDRQRLIEELTLQGTQMGKRYRENLALLQEVERLMADLQKQLTALLGMEQERLELTQELSQVQTRLEGLAQAQAAWQLQGAPRLAEIRRSLQEEDFAPEARRILAKVDAELKAIGYDAAAHDEARRLELRDRPAEAEFHALEKARAALAPLEREIADLEHQQATLETQVAGQRQEYERALAALNAAESQAPDLEAAERELLDLQEKENNLRLQVGAAQQKVAVLDDLKLRLGKLEAEREELARLAGRHKILERSFSKDGVPALLIEQALPQIEIKANDLLDRLSGGAMSVRFTTQQAYKDKRREDMKETLDIQISDGAGTRDYEMFSGGEAFRVNFAIRLALSELLAQRAGARLQTLVIDEGFGSQDAQGRQRLIEAINLVRDDFAKILVITHIDELKEAFPARIEVEKNERGSLVRVVSL